MKAGWEFFFMLQGLVLWNPCRDSLGPRTLNTSPEVACGVGVDLSWTRFWLCDLKVCLYYHSQGPVPLLMDMAAPVVTKAPQ